MKGLQDLKRILQDDKLWVYLGIIQGLVVAEDRSYLKVKVETLPEQRVIVATMSWDAVGPDSGEFEFPSPGDVVLLVNVDGDDDQAYVIKRLASRTDKIPAAAASGDKVSRALAGKKYWNVSDTRINLARGDDEPTENLVLGQVFKQFAIDLLTELSKQAQEDADHRHIGNLGYFTFVPDKKPQYEENKAKYDELKGSPIQDQAILSDLGFTEK